MEIKKKKVQAQDLFLAILKERAETGRIYIMNVDHSNTHSSFKDVVRMSNLCQEITLPTDPLQHIDGEGEIALCILSAINLGQVKNKEELEGLCDLSVRGLEELIDLQNYPVKAAEIRVKPENLNEELLYQYAENLYIMSQLSKTKMFAGGWFNKKTKENPKGDNLFYLDATMVVDDFADALYIGEAAEQKAIFNLSTFDGKAPNKSFKSLNLLSIFCN